MFEPARIKHVLVMVSRILMMHFLTLEFNFSEIISVALRLSYLYEMYPMWLFMPKSFATPALYFG